MKNLLLRAKHWQLFIAIVGFPIVFQITFMTFFAQQILSDSVNGEKSVMMPLFFIGIALVFLVSAGTLFGWMWSIATGLQSRVPEDVSLKVKQFKIFFLIPMIYFAALIIFGFTTLNGTAPNPGIFAIIVPLHLFSIFCIFYSMNFVAKTIKTVELQRSVTFSDFAGEFFLVWFYFVGIWILQPKVNRFHQGILKEDQEDIL